MSTERMNGISKDRQCLSLNVDDVEWDLYAPVNKSDHKVLHSDTRNIFGGHHGRERSYSPPVIRWKKDSVWYSAVVPIVTKTEKWSACFVSGSDELIDWDKMNLEAEKIIKGHNGRINTSKQ